ncbi:universal stress protein, partial [Streptomyces sp. SID8455]|nr:universal stress protein [Streptomyces sp. SID8455]
MTNNDLPVIAAVDGSTHSRQALDWAVREAARRRLPLVIVHVRPLTRTVDEETQLREADELLAEAVRRSELIAPQVRPSTLAPLDFPAAALVSLGRDASMVVVGSRGLGGFRSLIIGSNSLATASMASCPVVIVQDGR